MRCDSSQLTAAVFVLEGIILAIFFVGLAEIFFFEIVFFHLVEYAAGVDAGSFGDVSDTSFRGLQKPDEIIFLKVPEDAPARFFQRLVHQLFRPITDWVGSFLVRIAFRYCDTFREMIARDDVVVAE